VQDWARRTLTTIGEACRTVKAATLERGVDSIVEKLMVEHWSGSEIKAGFGDCSGDSEIAIARASDGFYTTGPDLFLRGATHVRTG